MDIPNYSLPIFLDLMSLFRVSMIQNAIRKANKKRLSSVKNIGAVYAFPDWRIMILLPLLQQLDRQM
jgi:Holliday junction resolvasome RuvABC DNA-binding subunit